MITDETRIKEKVVEHFQKLFKWEPTHFEDDFASVCLTVVNDGINNDLIKRVSLEEFGLGKVKSPSPDGFPDIFYQNHWELIKEDIMQMVNNFFISERLPP